MGNRLGEHVIQANVSSRDGWDTFRMHRTRTTALLRRAATAPACRLCIVGAGNCNDVDLAALLERYRQVHLVDLDGEAVASGIERQGLKGNPALVVHGDVDLTGVFDLVAAWTPTAALGEAELAACQDAPCQRVAERLAGPFNVVASTCVLSQLIQSVVRSAGESHPRFVPAFQAVRAGHLRLLAQLAAPGGAGLLITDIVSSETVPSLASTPEAALARVLAQLVQQRNFFHGLNPAVLASFFRTDPVAAPQVADLEPLPPWLWDLGPRVYGVCALQFRKHALKHPGQAALS